MKRIKKVDGTFWVYTWCDDKLEWVDYSEYHNDLAGIVESLAEDLARLGHQNRRLYSKLRKISQTTAEFDDD